jgi:hypothetical protein
MSRLNWSAPANRELVKTFLNDRLREVQSSLGLAATRRGLTTVATTAANSFSTITSIAKVIGIVDTTDLKRPLREVTVHEIRQKDPASEVTGLPEDYAIFKHLADSVQVLWYPQPDAVYTLSVDALLAGTELSANSDEPTFPEDFHDLLVHAAEADAWRRLEKDMMAESAERRFEKRLSELRYFIAKSAYLHQAPRDRYNGLVGRNVWPYNIPS